MARAMDGRRGQISPARAARAARGLARLSLPLLITAWLLWSARDRLMALDWVLVWQAARAAHPMEWAAALCATACGFAALGRYDALIHLYLDTGVAPARAARSGMAAIAISQMSGFGLVTGSLTRWSLLPELSAARAARVTLAVTVSFLWAWALIAALAVLILMPATAPFAPLLHSAAIGVLTLCLALILAGLALPALHLRGHRVALPPVLLQGRFLLCTAIDTGSAALALYVFLPDGAALSVTAFLPAYLLALGAGLIAGTPGGIGPFELTLAALCPGFQPEAFAGALLCYRAAYFALPAVLAGVMVIAGRLMPRVNPRGASPAQAVSDSEIASAHRAESALIRQAGTRPLRAQGQPGFWLTSPAGQVLAGLFDPTAGPRALPALLPVLAEEADRTGRLPALYKIEPRAAAMARRAGWVVHPYASEFWLHPAGFHTDGPARATLRRKLRHAETAGVTVRACAPGADLPIADLAAINKAWAGQHGGERGLSMGRFDPAHLASQRLFLAECDGQPVAFISLHAGAREWTLDLIRQTGAAPDGTIHLLILTAIHDAARIGLPRLSLAAAPLHGLGLSGRAARLAARLAPGTGLRQFKAGFAGRETPLYIAARSRPALALAAAEIARGIRWPGPLPRPPTGDISGIHDPPCEVEFAVFAPTWQR